MSFRGPPVLGRGVVVRPRQAPPPGCEAWPRVVVGDVDRAVADELHEAWLRRRPVVVEAAIDPGVLREPEADGREPWELTPEFEFVRERLQFLVWMNNWDCRGDEPVWWWARKAERLGARAGGPADVVLPDGTAAWVDGGPRQPLPVDGAVVVHRESVDLGALTVAQWGEPAAGALAPDQLAAVVHDGGAARVIAPAGSGKTRVLTERLRHLLADRGWEPPTVAAVAYNKRAADEMQERVAGLPARVRTLNSLGLALCNGTGGFAVPRQGARREVVDEPVVRQLLDRLVELQRAPNTDPYLPYLEGLRAIRLGLVDPAEAEVAVDAPGLADLFPRFCRLLDDNRWIDFDGQLYEAVRVLLREPEARRVAQRLSLHLLVDEFQDLTPVHLLLLRLLAAPAYDVFGVGDDDQVIYGFGGASPEFLIDFDRFFPGARAYALEVNYRCPPAVIDAAQTLLSYTPRRIAKSVRPAPGREPVDGELVVQQVDPLREAEWTADLLERWHAEGVGYEQMAALARVNAALLPLQITLGERGIPGRQPIDESILGRTGIRAALAYLRIGVDPGRIAPADVTETIRRPSRRIARNVVDMLTRGRATSVGDIRRLAGRLQGGDTRKLLDYAADLERVADAVAAGDTTRALRTIRVDVGLGTAMDVLDAARREADRSTHADDLVALEQAAALHRDPHTFESWLRDVLRRRSSGPGVELSTIHRVKGREWDRVVVFGVDDELLPHRLASDEDEERRLLHVAVTRGRDRVVVVADRERPSSFLEELAGTRSRSARRRVAARVAPPATRSRSAGAGGAGAVGAAPTVAAEVGMQVAVGGHDGVVVDVNDGGALVTVGRARLAVAFGTEVRVDGRTVRLGRAGDVARRDAVVEALKSWRREAAARDRVPAYVVLADKDLDGIADRAPRTLEELAACRGIGALRLERYGDELLAVVERALA